MSTIECPKCKKHGKIKPIEHPSNKDKPYFKCEDCGALFDEESDLWKILGAAGAGAAAVLSIFLGGS